MCGSKSIDGYAFCLGLDALEHIYEAHLVLRGLIRSVTYLIREAIFRSEYSTDSSSRAALNICPLGELMDMYHAHGATQRHDKVYALLGMSSDDLSQAGLLPDYQVPWEELLQRLIKFLLCKEISVETWGDKEIAVIKSKGCVLGKVTSVRGYMFQDNKQSVNVTLTNIKRQTRNIKQRSAHWTFQVSAKPIQVGDIICLLQGASNPTIIRLRKDHLAVIMIAVTPLDNAQTKNGHIERPTVSTLEKIFTRDFLLVWDWENSFEKLQDQQRYEMLMNKGNPVSKCSKTKSEDGLSKATRIWNVALILGDLEEYENAGENLREAVNHYATAFGKSDSCTPESQYGQTPLAWASWNGYDTVVNVLLAKAEIDPDLEDSQYGLTLLSWAAKEGHEAVVKLLLETGKVGVDSKDSECGRTPLSWAANSGYEALVKLLLESDKVDVDSKDSECGRTPLSWAAENGHEAVVKLLLETGKVDVGSKDNRYEATPLSWAAEKGHEAVVKLLLKTGKVDVDSKDSECGRTPLSWAAENGHKAVVKLLQ
jgi:ankyrin repeat protein